MVGKDTARHVPRVSGGGAMPEFGGGMCYLPVVRLLSAVEREHLTACRPKARLAVLPVDIDC